MKVYKFMRAADRVFCPDQKACGRGRPAVSARLLETLSCSRIFYSDPKSFNDPFDGACGLLYAGEADRASAVRTADAVIEELCKSGKLDDGSAAAYREEIQNDSLFLKDYRIACFSRRMPELMWAHYADQHTGVCLEYDFDSDLHVDVRLPAVKIRNNGVERGITDDSLFVIFWRDVLYRDKKPGLRIEEDRVTEGFNTLNAVITKSEIWSYEEEKRLIVRYAPSFQPDDTVYTDICKSCLNGVYFGCRIEKLIREEIQEWIRRDPEYDHVKMYRAVMDMSSFSVQYREM